MSTEGLDWQIVTRQRVRREAFWLAFIGVVMLIFGWRFLATASGTGFNVGVSNTYVWTLRIGGLFFVAIGAASLSGWRVWLLVGGAASAVVTAVFALNAVAWLAGGYSGWYMPAIYAAVFGFSAYSSIRAFLDSSILGLLGERTDLQFDRQPSGARASAPPAFEGRSLAGELLRRTRGQNIPEPADAPPSAPEPRPDAAAQPSAPKPARPQPPKQRSPEPSSAAASTLGKPKLAPPPPPAPEEAPEGFLAALAREEEEDEGARSS